METMKYLLWGALLAGCFLAAIIITQDLTLEPGYEVVGHHG